MLLHHNQGLLIPLILEQTQGPLWDRVHIQYVSVGQSSA
jgi:hypothetical protein